MSAASEQSPAGRYKKLIARYGGDLGEMARAGYDARGRGVVVMDLRGGQPRGRYLEADRYLSAVRRDSGEAVEAAEAAVLASYDPQAEAIIAVLTEDGHHGGAYRFRFPAESV